MLNDTVTLAAARSLAVESMREADGNPQSVAETMFRRGLTRPPTSDELDALCRFYKHQFSTLDQTPDDALTVVRSGDDKYEMPTDMSPQQLAAWMLTARVILNLEETLTRP